PNATRAQLLHRKSISSGRWERILRGLHTRGQGRILPKIQDPVDDQAGWCPGRVSSYRRPLLPEHTNKCQDNRGEMEIHSCSNWHGPIYGDLSSSGLLHDSLSRTLTSLTIR